MLNISSLTSSLHLNHSFTHLLTSSRSHSLTHTLTDFISLSFTHTHTHTLIHSLAYSLTSSRPHSPTNFLTHLFTLSLTHYHKHSIISHLYHSSCLSFFQYRHGSVKSQPWNRVKLQRGHTLMLHRLDVRSTMLSLIFSFLPKSLTFLPSLHHSRLRSFFHYMHGGLMYGPQMGLQILLPGKWPPTVVTFVWFLTRVYL